MAPGEAHNQIVVEFTRRIGTVTQSSAELMVIVESMIFGAMLLNMQVHGATPRVASGLVEAAVQQAIERFTAKVNAEG